MQTLEVALCVAVIRLIADAQDAAGNIPAWCDRKKTSFRL